MKRPYVVAHVLSSIDGRIQIHNWPPLNTSRVFESTAETFKSDAWIVGRTTMQEFFQQGASQTNCGRFAFPEGRRAMRCRRCKSKTTGNCSHG